MASVLPVKTRYLKPRIIQQWVRKRGLRIHHFFYAIISSIGNICLVWRTIRIETFSFSIR